MHGSRIRSRVLVASQFVLIALLAAPLAGLVPQGAMDLPGALCLLGSLVLVIAAFLAMRRRDFTVMPEPRPGSRLIEHGPYARIRHPMYTAVLLGGLGAALLHGGAVDGLLLVLLVCVMVTKLRHEERLLQAAHPGYAAYRTRTAALMPGVY